MKILILLDIQGSVIHVEEDVLVNAVVVVVTSVYRSTRDLDNIL